MIATVTLNPSLDRHVAVENLVLDDTNRHNRDGLRVFNSPTAIYKAEPYGTEGIAILKGPASSLYGVSGPGGIVKIAETLVPKWFQHGGSSFSTNFSIAIEGTARRAPTITIINRKKLLAIALSNRSVPPG